MPEIVHAIARYKTIAELDAELAGNDFQEIPASELDPTIRRSCERYGEGVGTDRLVAGPMRFELVKALKTAGALLQGEVVFGTWECPDRTRAFVGVHRDMLQVVIVHNDWVERRRSRYEADPLPQGGKERFRHVQTLIYEVVERWSGTDPDTLGSTYASIYMHVADYCNIEIAEARALVDVELERMDYLEKSEGDCWRIPPKLLLGQQMSRKGSGTN